MIVCIKVYLCCLVWPALAGSWSQEPGIRLRHSGVECRHLSWCLNCWVDCSVPSFNVFLFSFCFNSSCNLLSSFSSSLCYSTYRRFKYWTSLQQNFALIYIYFWLKRPVDFIFFFFDAHWTTLFSITYNQLFSQGASESHGQIFKPILSHFQPLGGFIPRMRHEHSISKLAGCSLGIPPCTSGWIPLTDRKTEV